MADQMTFYPDADPESTSCDGRLSRQLNEPGEIWAGIRSSDGNGAIDSTDISEVVTLACAGTTNRWSVLRRSIFLFDTSGLPDNAEISSAVFSIYGQGKTRRNNWPELNIYSANPSSNTALVANDFTMLGTTAYCDDTITYSEFSITGYNSFTLNSAGIAAISKTGITKLGVRDAVYDVGGATPVWEDGYADLFRIYFAENTGTDHDPKLVVTYTTGWSGKSMGVTAPAKVNGVAKISIAKVNGVSSG